MASKQHKLPEGAISIREYSRLMKCSDTSVRKAIIAGKIEKGVIVDGDSYIGIWPDIATEEWGKNSNPNYAERPSSKPPERISRVINNKKEKEDKETEEDSGESGVKGGSIAKIKQYDALYKAKTTELLYRQKTKDLINRKQAYDEFFAAGQSLRLAFTALPDRIIDDLIAMPTRAEAYKFLAESIMSVLEELADNTPKILIEDAN